MGKQGLPKIERKRRKEVRGQVIEEGVIKVGAQRGQRATDGAR